LDGSSVDLAAKPTWKVIYFWSASCPCVVACENYTLKPLAEKYGAKVAFYGVVSGKYELGMNRDDLKSLIQERHLPFPILLDPDHTVAAALNAQVTPQTFLLVPSNHIVFSGMPDDTKRYLHATGRSGLTDSYLGDALAQALAGKKVTRPLVQNEGCIIGW
jgi:peroxiredoxin